MKDYISLIINPGSTSTKIGVYKNLEQITEKTFSIYFPEVTWERNKRYTYLAELGNDYYIQFSNPTVEPWTEERASGTIIIK